MCFFTMGSIHLPIRNGEMARLPPNYLTPPGKARIDAPVEIGDVVIPNILGTGVDIIATNKLSRGATT